MDKAVSNAPINTMHRKSIAIHSPISADKPCKIKRMDNGRHNTAAKHKDTDTAVALTCVSIVAQHSRQAQRYGYEQRRDHRYGYEKPKNPYNNGINSPNRQFYRGGQLPTQYRGDRGQRYVIVNWHEHRDLYAPPVGMRWNYIDGRYILATIATGIIYNIIYGS